VNVVAILGSPRPKGNSTAIAEKFLESARNYGAKVKIHNLITIEKLSNHYSEGRCLSRLY